MRFSMVVWRHRWTRVLCILLVLVALPLASQTIALGQPAKTPNAATSDKSPLTILVADPLAKELACDCVGGFAQRRYVALAMVLEKRLQRRVESVCAAELAAMWSDDKPVALIVGKHSDVLAQADQLGRKVYPIAALTDSQGLTTLRGLFIVRSGNSARTLADLNGYRILFGPASSTEKNAAAISALKNTGIRIPSKLETAASCTDAANALMKLPDTDKVAAVISDYAKILLEGCHTIPKGAIRVIGKTEPVPFVTVFATDEVPPAQRQQIRAELIKARRFNALLRLLQSKEGFKPLAVREPHGSAQGWLDFRGHHRLGLVDMLPDTLGSMRVAWTAPLTGRGLGGIAATHRAVLVTDRDEPSRVDYLKMFDLQSGRLLFAGDLINPSPLLATKDLDYGNSVRTTPLVHAGHVYVLDAYGTLYSWPLPKTPLYPATECIKGVSTALLASDFELPKWGISATPLVVSSPDGTNRLVVSVSTPTKALLALDPDALADVWSARGHGSAYASCIAGQFGGRRQIVGYDTRSLNGWDPATGRRLWTVPLEYDEDYIVPTPVAVDDAHLLTVSENNGMRLYEFDGDGILSNSPVAVNDDITTGTVTPVAVAGRVYCAGRGALYQLDTTHGLQAIWSMTDEAFANHVSLIADTAGTRLLVTAYDGKLLLFDIAGDRPALRARRAVFAKDKNEEVYAHPAIVGNRLLLRGLRSLRCVEF